MENIVKELCKEQGLTYKELAERLGLSEASIKRLATSDEINSQVVKACEMLREIENLKNELKDLQILKEIVSKWAKN